MSPVDGAFWIGAIVGATAVAIAVCIHRAILGWIADEVRSQRLASAVAQQHRQDEAAERALAARRYEAAAAESTQPTLDDGALERRAYLAPLFVADPIHGRQGRPN